MLLDKLKKSINNNYSGFYLLYQPQINTKDLTLLGVEALLRFKTEDSKIISPLDFIPILEETGLIHEVGMWVLETALKQLKIWNTALPNLRMSVNFSSIQLTNKKIVKETLELLKKYEIQPNKLTIEITTSGILATVTVVMIVVSCFLFFLFITKAITDITKTLISGVIIALISDIRLLPIPDSVHIIPIEKHLLTNFVATHITKIIIAYLKY